MCASWLVRSCEVMVYRMSAWAMVSGLAVDVFRVTAVEARASSACSPSCVRLPLSLERRRSSSSFRTTYRCEQLCSLDYDHERSYLI